MTYAQVEKRVILITAEDLMKNFLFYDRRDDEELPRGAIEKALRNGTVTVDDILAVFRSALEEVRDDC